MERLSGECLFCGRVGGLTGQHVFDDWLQGLGFGGEGLREIVEEAEPARRILQPGGPFTKKIRVVCDPCNGIWLSTMEGAAKPLLLEMFRASGQVMLDGPAQLTLARWAFKIVCVLSQLGSKKTFPLAHCREFRESDLPPTHSQIWIGSASVKVTERGQQLAESRYRPHIANLTVEGRTISAPCYSARFRLLNVVFDIFGHVQAEFGLHADLSEDLRRALLPIWPSEHPTIWWPPATSLDVIGGVQGLADVPLEGIPTVIPPATAPQSGK